MALLPRRLKGVGANDSAISYSTVAAKEWETFPLFYGPMTSTKSTSSGFLDQSLLFLSASPELKSRLESLAVKQRLAKHEVLFRQGDAGDALYVIDEGMIEINVLTPGGRKLSLNVMRPGDVLGEIAMLDGGPRTASAVALRPCRLRCLRRRDVFSAMRSEIDLAFDLIQILGERLRWISAMLEDQAYSPLPVRVANKLLFLVDHMADERGAVPVSQEALANFAGATREGVAKVLGQWKRQGWIEVMRAAVRVKDRAALEEVSRTLAP